MSENALDPRPRFQSAFLAAWLGNIEEARYQLDDIRGRARDDDIDSMQVWTEMWFGDGALAKTIHDRIKVNTARKEGGPECMVFFADVRAAQTQPSEAQILSACGAANLVFAYFGYVDATFAGFADEEWAKVSDSIRLDSMYLFMPHMRAVRADPRFMPFAARAGLVDYWLDTDQWPDFCATEKLPYDCKEAALAAREAAAKSPNSASHE